jgi:putative peptide zinc metalloprotease protein
VYELVLADATRVPLETDVTLGRDPRSTVVLNDPSVSRVHARISPGNGEAPLVEDAGSSHGTFLDGVRVTRPMRLHDGARLRLGDSELAVERRRDAAEAGRTIVVPSGGTVETEHPRLRPGYALKRLEASEGSKRWVLKDLESGVFLRFSDDDAALLQQLDGSHSLADLIAGAESRFGPTGPARLARLLADLGERGFLAGIQSASAGFVEAPQPRWRQALEPREKLVPGAGAAFEAVYRRGGWVLFTRPALIAIAAIVVAGLGVFVYLVAERYGTPFVVASKLGLGGLVFLVGRFAVVAVHELAHGLAMAAFGRRVDRAGFKAMLIFPYAFVDTSEAWFEPRRRRIAISAAGPGSDLLVGALLSIACLAAPAGSVRDVFFQVAFAAYIGACFNLNPFLDRDGYHILVDVLREPNLRRRAREQFARRLAGGASEGDSPVLVRYSLFALGWSVLAALFVIAMTLRYRPTLEALAPDWIVWTLMASVWVVVFVPVVLAIARPLKERLA